MESQIKSSRWKMAVSLHPASMCPLPPRFSEVVLVIQAVQSRLPSTKRAQAGPRPTPATLTTLAWDHGRPCQQPLFPPALHLLLHRSTFPNDHHPFLTGPTVYYHLTPNFPSTFHSLAFSFGSLFFTPFPTSPSFLASICIAAPAYRQSGTSSVLLA